jgi:hypothetical protein
LSITVTIGGSKVKAKKVPEKRLTSTWRALTKKPFPRLIALQLEDDDFDSTLELMKKSDFCRENERREIEEWGRTLASRGTDACVFDTDEYPDIDYIILVRENPYHSLAEIIEHELSHIVRGDL